MDTNIIVAADLVPTESNYDLFSNGDIKSLIGEDLSKLLSDADFIVMNLETPICDEETPIKKCGPCLKAPCSTISGIKSINPHFFTLANNHIMDQGESGLISTINILKDNNIEYSGVGKNIDESKKPYIKEINGIRIGIYCCAEHEFSIASDSKMGANPYDPLESFDHVRLLKDRCDYVIVLYHGGKEEFRYPSPLLQKIFHKFAECGADLVVAQHTHCVGCCEVYNGSTLVYGQGNFLFDYSDSVFWQTSVLVSLTISKEKKTINYIPILKKGKVIKKADKDDASCILREFKERSEEIKDTRIIEKKYKEYSSKMLAEYLIRISGRRKNIFFRALNKISNYRFVKKRYSDDSKLLVRNVIECEAHRELFLNALMED